MGDEILVDAESEKEMRMDAESGKEMTRIWIQWKSRMILDWNRLPVCKREVGQRVGTLQPAV